MATGTGKTSIDFTSDNEHSTLLSCSCFCGYLFQPRGIFNAALKKLELDLRMGPHKTRQQRMQSERLLRKVERSLTGTLFQGPVGAYNTIIEVIKVHSTLSLYRAVHDDDRLRRSQATRIPLKNVLSKLLNVSRS